MKFCIVGTGRSGTTLMYRMLDTHPDIFVFNETHWLPVLFEQFGSCSVETELLLELVMRTRHVTGEAVLDIDQAWAEDLPVTMTVVAFQNALGLYLARQEGKSEWGDKTPDYGFFGTQLQHYWPDCKFVHVVRDGLATALSMSRHPGYRALVALKLQNWTRVAIDFKPPKKSFPVPPIEACADLWYNRLMRIMDESQQLRSDSYLELRFEDLLRDPTESLRKTADFLKLPANDHWLAEAAMLVDPVRRSRSINARPDQLLPHFNPRQQQLLRDLGYGAGSPAERN